jgi:hypothetical protein
MLVLIMESSICRSSVRSFITHLQMPKTSGFKVVQLWSNARKDVPRSNPQTDVFFACRELDDFIDTLPIEKQPHPLDDKMYRSDVKCLTSCTELFFCLRGLYLSDAFRVGYPLDRYSESRLKEQRFCMAFQWRKSAP